MKPIPPESECGQQLPPVELTGADGGAYSPPIFEPFPYRFLGLGLSRRREIDVRFVGETHAF